MSASINFFMVVAVLVAGFVYWWTDVEPNPKLPVKSVAESSYDYIIVGGGSAGCVVATRLSEDPATKVLLLEAGDDGTDIALRVPGLAPVVINGTFDWKYVTTKQEKGCLALNGQVCTWPRGKTLGGSGSINGMIAVRGSRHDFDEWAARGMEGWSFEDVLPYFKKLENVAPKQLRESPYRGTSGLVNVSFLKQTPISDYITQAAVELNMPTGEDYNDMTNMEGVHDTQVHIMNGKRSGSSAQQYLWPVMGRTNLHVVVHAHVTKIIFEGKTAAGVEYTGKDGVSRTVKAKKEVILSAGSIASPQLLMLSGVGPKAHLQELGIPVVADLPVGVGIKDFPAVMLPQMTIDQPLSVTTEDFVSYATEFKYKMWKSGVRSNAYLIDNVIYHRTEYAKKKGLKVPDLEILVMVTPMKVGFRNSFDFTDEALHGYFENSGKYGFSNFICLTRPESTGYIRLRSSDPYDKPLLNPRYLTRTEDVQRYIEGIKLMQKLINTDAMKKIGAKILDYTVPFPACRDHTVGTDEYWTCLVHQGAWAFQSALGSCKMGPENDPNAVVDPQLRVRGLKNLRIVDASILPSSVTGNLNTVTLMTAEKASDMIRGVQSVKKVELEDMTK